MANHTLRGKGLEGFFLQVQKPLNITSRAASWLMIEESCYLLGYYSNPLQYSCLENPMDGGAWWAAVHGVVKSRTWLSDFNFTFHFNALEKKMAPHYSVLAWRIPGMVEPGGLLSMGSHRVGHNWSDLAAAAGYYSALFYLLISWGGW